MRFAEESQCNPPAGNDKHDSEEQGPSRFSQSVRLVRVAAWIRAAGSSARTRRIVEISIAMVSTGTDELGTLCHEGVMQRPWHCSWPDRWVVKGVIPE